MSSRKAANASTQAAQIPDTAAAHEPATAEADAAGAGAVPALASAQAGPDENQGRGGRYRRNADGSRTLIERTQRA